MPRFRGEDESSLLPDRTGLSDSEQAEVSSLEAGGCRPDRSISLVKVSSLEERRKDPTALDAPFGEE